MLQAFPHSFPVSGHAATDRSFAGAVNLIAATDVPGSSAAAAKPAPVIALEVGVVYLSPRGKRCRWWPDPRYATATDANAHQGQATFVYDTPGGTAAVSALNGFTLTRANWPLLRKA